MDTRSDELLLNRIRFARLAKRRCKGEWGKIYWNGVINRLQLRKSPCHATVEKGCDDLLPKFQMQIEYDNLDYITTVYYARGACRSIYLSLLHFSKQLASNCKIFIEERWSPQYYSLKQNYLKRML